MGAKTFLSVIGVVQTLIWIGKAQNPACLRNMTGEPPLLNFGSFMKPPEKPTHPCLRDCTNSAPMNCDYTLVVEWYYTMAKACYDCPCNLDDCYRDHCVTADGVPRSIIVANRTFPGPPIEVCEGDHVTVNVINSMDNGEAIALHWHGLHMKFNQYMDGVYMVTQCPITSGNSFKYNFTADHAGTHWWHAHTGMHRADGLFGALFIRQSKQADPHGPLYDYDLSEHKLIINDWTHEETVALYLNHHFRDGDEDPVSILINGKGAFAVYGADASTSTVTPREVYEVQQGKRYRFRVISSGVTNIPIKVSVDGHNITLISSDGDSFEPLEVDAFFLFGGERYDFILDASQEIGNYWLKVKGYEQGMGLQGLAVIRYQGAASDKPAADPSLDRQGMVYQDMVRSYSEPDAVTTVNELRSLTPYTSSDKKRTIYLDFDLQAISNPMFNDPDLYPVGPDGPGWADFLLPQINHRTFQFTNVPLLSQYDDEIHSQALCDIDQQAGFENCDTELCACTQVISVELGETVEIVLIDESNNTPYDILHPFHFHGHHLRILAQGRLGDGTTKEDIIQLDQNGGIIRNYDHPPEKDTFNVPSGGYTVVEFVADNPGWWIFHCHMEYHLEDGMGILVRVGDQSDLPPVPEGFPKCGNYPDPASPAEHSDSSTTTGPTVIVLIIIIVLLALIILALIVVIVCRGRSRDDGKGKVHRVPLNDR